MPAVGRGWWLAALIVPGALLAFGAGGQETAPAAESEPTGDRPPAFGSGAQAYEAGAYDEALARFIELQVGRPQDPALMMNIGSTHFRRGDFEAAKRGFGAAAVSAEEPLKAQAVYNLGNVAFRVGRLQEAVELYKSALEIDPDDMDSKFNLEFVRREIASQQTQDQQQAQDSQQDQTSEEKGQDGQPSDPSNQNEGEGAQQEEPESPQPPPRESDADQDGLPDHTETSGENPTDPNNPDSDGDGLLDGEEDRNRNGRTDPGETDPNNPDSNGNGIDDGAEAQSRQGESQPGEQPGELSEEEAERYLQALHEGRPQNRRPRGRANRRGQEKDW